MTVTQTVIFKNKNNNKWLLQECIVCVVEERLRARTQSWEETEEDGPDCPENVLIVIVKCLLT